MQFDKLKIINLTQLANLSKVSYAKLYFRKNGEIKSELDLNDRTKIVNAIHKEIEPLFSDLGFSVEINQKVDRSR